MQLRVERELVPRLGRHVEVRLSEKPSLGLATSKFWAKNDGTSEDHMENLRPVLEGLWPFLDSFDVWRKWTTVSKWCVARKYGLLWRILLLQKKGAAD